MAEVPIITPTRKNIFTIDLLRTPIDFKIAISLVLFLIVLVGAIYSEKDNIVNYFVESGLITLSLNLLMMIIAFFLAHFFGSGIKQKKTIAIECGLQNGTLAIFVGTIMFGGGIYIIPAATYSLIMFATSILFVLFLRNSN